MLFGNTVEFAHVALGLVPEILDTVNVISTLCEDLGVVDAEALKRADVQCVIAPPTVRINDAVWRYFTLDKGNQRLASGVRDDACVNLSTALK